MISPGRKDCLTPGRKSPGGASQDPRKESSLLRVAWGQLADISSSEWAGLGSSSHPAGKMPGRLQEGCGHSQATQQPRLARLPRPSSPPGSLRVLLSYPPPSLWVHIPTPTPLRAPSPTPVLSLTTFDVSSDYFRKCHQASHKAHILGASLLGLRSDLPTQGTWIRSLLGELRFHMPWDK